MSHNQQPVTEVTQYDLPRQANITNLALPHLASARSHVTLMSSHRHLVLATMSILDRIGDLFSPYCHTAYYFQPRFKEDQLLSSSVRRRSLQSVDRSWTKGSGFHRALSSSIWALRACGLFLFGRIIHKDQVIFDKTATIIDNVSILSLRSSTTLLLRIHLTVPPHSARSETAGIRDGRSAYI